MMRGYKLKKIFAVIGIIFLVIILVLNIGITAFLSPIEVVTICYNNIAYVFDLLLLVISIFLITNIINKFLYKNEKRKMLRKVLLIVVAIIYISATIAFSILFKPSLKSDQKAVGIMAFCFNTKESDEL